MCVLLLMCNPKPGWIRGTHRPLYCGIVKDFIYDFVVLNFFQKN